LCPCKVRNKFLVNFWNCAILLWTPCIFFENRLWNTQTIKLVQNYITYII
jgi:hypothetical protein